MKRPKTRRKKIAKKVRAATEAATCACSGSVRANFLKGSSGPPRSAVSRIGVSSSLLNSSSLRRALWRGEG